MSYEFYHLDSVHVMVNCSGLQVRNVSHMRLRHIMKSKIEAYLAKYYIISLWNTLILLYSLGIFRF